MKTLIVALLTALILSSSQCFATDSREKAAEVKYKVTISVTYNAVSIAEAGKMIADSLEQHKTACVNKASTEKVGINNSSTFVVYAN